MDRNAVSGIVDANTFRRAVEKALPLAGSAQFESACDKVRRALDEYAALKGATQRQLSVKQIRRELTNGHGLFSQTAKWMADAEHSAVRDYVLMAMSDGPQDRPQIALPWRTWKPQIANLGKWSSWVNAALPLVRSDLGQPENFPLKQLVRDLSKIWNDLTTLPFTSTRKGRQQPRHFVSAICRMIEPDLTNAQIETAIRYAVRKLPGGRRGRKSMPGGTD